MAPRSIKFTLLLLLSSHTAHSAFTLDDSPHKNAAMTWASRYLYNNEQLLVDKNDLVSIANVCYLSFMRSYHTLKAQELAHQATTALWQGWQNIAQTRLNPSQPAPYVIPHDQQSLTGEIFWKEHNEHQYTNAAYAHAIDYCITNNHVSSRTALDALSDLRSRSRSCMAKTLLDLRTYLHKKTSDTKGIMNIWKGFCFLKHLASYIPQLALNTITSADELTNTVSDSGWQALDAVQTLGIYTWRTIEENRASFYLAHYQAVSLILQHLQLRAPLMFDIAGLIPEKNRTKILPINLIRRSEHL